MIERIVIMGVSGCGKSSVGAALSQKLDMHYRDGDDLHPASNIDKMSRGIALTDQDRWPWLDQIARELNENAPLIIGCSALKRIYRDRLRAGTRGEIVFVHLLGSKQLIAQRMSERTGHYMPTSLLDDQFASLEAPGPSGAISIEIDMPLLQIVSEIVAKLEERKHA